MPVPVDLLHLSGHALFSLPFEDDPSRDRVWGRQTVKKFGVDVYPASLPFCFWVLNDLEIVYGKDLEYTERARSHVDKMNKHAEYCKKDRVPKQLDFVYPPYAHQKRGLARAIYNPRYALWYDMGLGKSKIGTDMLRWLKRTGELTEVALVIAPTFLVQVWVDELNKHTFEGELRAQPMCDIQGNALAPETRMAIYQDTPPDAPDPQWRYYEEFPTVMYEPEPEGLPDKFYAHEREYVEAIYTDDSEARRKARSRMYYWAKKSGHSLRQQYARVVDPNAYLTQSEADVLIMSYDVMAADEERIRNHLKIDSMIFDEVHYLCSPNSNRGKAARALAHRSPRVLELTGTPVKGNPWHAYTPLYVIHPETVGEYHEFERRFQRSFYLGGDRSRKNKRVAGYKNLDLLSELQDEVSDTMTTQDCADLDLPELNIIDVTYELTGELKEAYNEMVSLWETDPGAYDADVIAQMGTDRIIKLLQILSGFIMPSRDHFLEMCSDCPYLADCARADIMPYTPECRIDQGPAPEVEIHRYDTQPKLDLVCEYVQSITRKQGNKVIVWCTYIEEIKMVAERLDAMDIGYVKVDGSTQDKALQQRRFREDADLQVYLSNISICEGFTLNEANYTIYYGWTYNQGHYEQSLKRNHRIGQEDPVTVYRFLAKGSIHEYLRDSLDQKEKINDVISGLANCAGCDRSQHCLANKIELFSEDCVYSDAPDRVVTRPKMIK